jgi:G3E family GTPase
VVDLLVEQVECADFIVLNKMDRCTAEEVRRRLFPERRVVSFWISKVYGVSH